MLKLTAILLSTLFVINASAGGKMAEIYTMTNESVAEALGFDEESIQIYDHRFVSNESKSIQVQTKIKAIYSSSAWTCLTTFKPTQNFFEVAQTDCIKN